MSTLSDVAELFWSGFEILAPFLGVTLAGAGVALVNELKRKGYQATYLEALVRATGAGVAAAHAQKLDPFTGEGKRLVLAVGSEYLADTVGDAANAFGLSLDDHATRIEAQLGVVQAQAEAVAQASVVKAATLSIAPAVLAANGR
jgi:hypothetical protein